MPRLTAALALLLGLVATRAATTVTTQAGASAPAPAAAGGPAATDAEARAVCTPCHLFPPPDILPATAWRDEMVRMAVIRDNRPAPRSGTSATIPLPADMERVLLYYLAHAPKSLPVPTTWPAADRSGFDVHPVTAGSGMTELAIANVRFLDVDGDARLELLATDMRYGVVLMGRPYRRAEPPAVLAQLNNPAHISMADFNADGIKDFLVGDLGEFLPADHTHGSVVWLRGTKEGKYAQLALDGWPRVADVEAADFNGDGTLDLAVAAFGWRKVGTLTVLENHTTDYTQPSFVPRVVDPRPGSIHALPADLNKDGRPDLVALIAQQFETVVAYINTGAAETTFAPQVIYTAPHPNWGSSGIQLVDLDGDGDLDVLLTHGDTFDDQIIKPYHGIQWLENQGGYPFVEHSLADLPGVARAQAADLDGDGDQDIVASAFIAGGADVDESKLAALVWLEQVKPGVFTRHTLEMGRPRHATLDVADFDQDGDMDIAVGNFIIEPRQLPAVDIWENKRITAAPGSTK